MSWLGRRKPAGADVVAVGTGGEFGIKLPRYFFCMKLLVDLILTRSSFARPRQTADPGKAGVRGNLLARERRGVEGRNLAGNVGKTFFDKEIQESNGNG